MKRKLVRTLALTLACTMLLGISSVAMATEYVVVSGDNLTKIANQYNTTWQTLAELNELENPNLIFPDQVILLPDVLTPESIDPEVVAPEVTTPDMVEPEIDVPEVTEPEIPAAPTTYETMGVVDYQNVYFDFSETIAEEIAMLTLLPVTTTLPLSAVDQYSATGVELVSSVDSTNTTDFYLNALVAGNEITLSSSNSSIISAESSISGSLTVEENYVSFVPTVLNVTNLVDEVVTLVLEDGTQYAVHTLNESMPTISINQMSVDDANAGVYTFQVDKFMLRISTDGDLYYYRDVHWIGDGMLTEGFAPHDSVDGRYYSYFVELNQEFADATGGYSSGLYVVMDEHYVEIDYMTLTPNDDENHTHGEGYLDQHEFIILGEDHYITLSYTPKFVSNIPASLGTTEGYVWAGIVQEVQDGNVLWEVCTTDYPLLYETAVESFDYTNSTDQGAYTLNELAEVVFALSAGWQDYTHVNSVDYILAEDGTIAKLLLSMRNQSAVYQIDMESKTMDWVLGGKGSTLSGYEDYTTLRTDALGKETFQALTYAQHTARYVNKNEDGTMTEPPEISVFDNQTGEIPFLRFMSVPNNTRTMTITINEEAASVQVANVIDGVTLDALTGLYHNTSHCGSVYYQSDSSVVIGWGLHAVVDMISDVYPEGSAADIGFADLRMGSRPIVTEYDLNQSAVTFELSVVRNANYTDHDALYSYRTYKTVD